MDRIKTSGFRLQAEEELASVGRVVLFRPGNDGGSTKKGPPYVNPEATGTCGCRLSYFGGVTPLKNL
jgi:hypothetical protein